MFQGMEQCECAGSALPHLTTHREGGTPSDYELAPPANHRPGRVGAWRYLLDDQDNDAGERSGCPISNTRLHQCEAFWPAARVRLESSRSISASQIGGIVRDVRGRIRRSTLENRKSFPTSTTPSRAVSVFRTDRAHRSRTLSGEARGQLAMRLDDREQFQLLEALDVNLKDSLV